MPQKRDGFSVRNAIASHFGMDSDEIKDFRYQPTRTPCAIYTPIDSGFFTATKGARKPRESDDRFMGCWKWREVPACGYAGAMGWHIWEAIDSEE